MMLNAYVNRFAEMCKNLPLWVYDHIRHDRLAQEPYDNLQAALNALIDISNIPPAKGKLRSLQLTEVLLLKVFDNFCRRHDFKYFIAYGTLIGALRHKGFIPWDDDLDVFVFADQYEQVKQALIDELKGTDFYLWGVEKARFRDATLRISHKVMPSLNLDIFYLFPSSLTPPLPSDTSETIQRFRKHYLFELQYDIIKRANCHTLQAFQERTDTSYRKLIHACDPSIATSFIPNPLCNLFCINKEDVLPLKPISFEGIDTFSPQNPEQYLEARYGDWMSFPSHFIPHADLFMHFDATTVKQMNNILERCISAGSFM